MKPWVLQKVVRRRPGKAADRVAVTTDRVPKSQMFTGTPGDRFPHRVETLGAFG